METKSSRAFSLVEVVIAMAVAAFALVAILALLPMGLQSANSAVGDTRSSMIAQDVALRLRSNLGTLTSTGATPTAGTVFSKLATTNYYDANGYFLGSVYTNALYRVDATRDVLKSYPQNTDPSKQDANNAYSSQLEAAVVTVGWPVITSTGSLTAGNPTTNTYTFYLRVTPNL